MRNFTVVFAARAGRNPSRRDVVAHDRMHAAYKAWRAAGLRTFPRVDFDLQTRAIKFDGVMMQVIES